MPTIEVRTAAGRCRVELSAGALASLGEAVARSVPGARSVLVVSDTNVWPLYGKRALESLRGAGLSASEAVF